MIQSLLVDTPSWLAPAEVISFIAMLVGAIGMVITIINNRLSSWKKFNDAISVLTERMSKTELCFEQYQRDMKHYLDICELCRADVRKHHEGVTAEHVTPALRDQINSLVLDMRDIKKILMEGRA